MLKVHRLEKGISKVHLNISCQGIAQCGYKLEMTKVVLKLG